MSNRDGHHEIYAMNRDASNQKRLTFNNIGNWHPYWSPDGSSVKKILSHGRKAIFQR
jgi:TolB protein